MIRIGKSYFNASLVAFDKDGTLIDLNSLWVPWMTHLFEGIGRRISVDAYGFSQIAAGLGFDPDKQVILPDSPLATATREELLTIIAGALYRLGTPWLLAWDVAHGLENGFEDLRWVQPRADLSSVLGQLHRGGLKLALITTDSRPQTEATLQMLGIRDFFDILACADDGLQVKPEPHMLLYVCEQTGVSPEQCAVVGDTVYDMIMAQRAGAGLRVGITGGGSSGDELSRLAHVVIDSIEEIESVTAEVAGT